MVANVPDRAGAVIPGAQAGITHEGTGASRSDESSEADPYGSATLTAGIFRAEVHSDGGFRHPALRLRATITAPLPPRVRGTAAFGPAGWFGL